MADNRIQWYVNDYEGVNTRGLGAYWGYLFGALDRRNFATCHHAPLDDSSRSADSSNQSTVRSEMNLSNDEENASKSN